jgi:ABC-type antimicrobial peptide transport system permease subunit
LVLLASCANSANLFLSRSVSKVRELAMRAALGAGHLRLIRHFLTESIIVAITGGVVGTALSWAALRGLQGEVFKTNRVCPAMMIQGM